MPKRSTIITAGMHAVIGIEDHDASQTKANVFSGMPVRDILADEKESRSVATSPRLFLEDLFTGREFRSAEYTLGEAEIIAFASMYDPQPFHTDPDKAKELFFKGHSASGWQTAAITMRLLVTSIPLDCGIIGIGGELVWLKPVRPGDTLHVTAKATAIHVSQSKPGKAVVTWFVETLNQHGEAVQTLTTKTMVFGKDAQRD